MKNGFIFKYGVRLAALAALASVVLFTIVMVLSFQSDKNLFSLWETVLESEDRLFALRQDANKMYEIEHRLSMGAVYLDEELRMTGIDLMKVPSLEGLTRRRIELLAEAREAMLRGQDGLANRILRSREFEQVSKELRDRLFEFEVNERNRLQEKLAIRIESQERILEFDKAGILLAVILLVSALALISFYIRQLSTFDKQLMQARNEAERASRMKSAFLANMSHEIRTPLNGVVGLTRLLADTNLTGDQRKLIDSLETSGQTLMAIVNDILDLSKIESGKIELVDEPYLISRIFGDCGKTFSAAAERKSLRLEFERSGDDPALLGDEVKIRQVLQNLISNAIKFTERGEVRVSWNPVGRGRMRFEVRDSGIGIPESAARRLFRPFEQVDSSTSRTFGGTGLGLAICRHLVEAMGGQIGVESKAGLGSLFWFEMPLRTTTKAVRNDAPTEPPIPPPAASGQQTSVLLVEDNEVNRAVVETFLKRMGWTVISAENGVEGLKKVSEHRVDVVLMDCHLPEMDGFEAVRRIRQGEAGAAARHVPIIALTASAIKGERERCLAAGMDDYLTKPVDLDHLVKTMQKFRAAPPVSRIPELDDDLRIELERIFLRTLPGRQADLLKHIREKAWINAAKAAHTIKGSSAQLGFMQLAETCRQMEAKGFAEESEGWEMWVERFEAEVEELERRLHQDLDKGRLDA